MSDNENHSEDEDDCWNPAPWSDEQEEAFAKAIDDAQRAHGGRVFCMKALTNAAKRAATPATMDVPWLLANCRPIFVTPQVIKVLTKNREKIEMIQDAPYGATQVGNDMFIEVMMPLLARAKKAEKKKPKDWTTVFAELLSVSVDNEQYWMHDNECWMDNKWAQFFYEYSDLWRKLLAQPDSEIIGAFAPPPADAAQAALFAGVTRRSVTEHLQRWQKECNSTLKDGASNSMSGRYKGKPAEVTIFP